MTQLEELPTPLLINPELAETLLYLETGECSPEESRKELGKLLQSALELEFATIPIYLSAAFSLHGDTNKAIRRLIMRIAKEEMLHLTVVANLMNAIGITPDIIKAVPSYPYKLKILDPASPLTLNLESFSFDLVKNVFMQIEAPEDPKDYPMFGKDQKITIGQFYEKIIEIIKSDKIPDLFKDAEKNKYKQIKVKLNFEEIYYKSDSKADRFPLKSGIDFVITNKDAAVRHLQWVVSEGEGTKDGPLDGEGLPGHYYRFQSILKKKYLIENENAEEGYSYSGGSLKFDREGVAEFKQNAKAKDSGGKIKKAMIKFNKDYTSMVKDLNTAFSILDKDQSKEAYNSALRGMSKLRRDANHIVKELKGGDAGVPFEFLPEISQY